MRDRLQALVRKSGVGLGGLGPAERDLALVVPAYVLSEGQAVGEAQVSAMLAEALAGPAGYLDTDPAELRRWLVDTGWWRRDPLGRAYVRTPEDQLPPELREIVEGLEEMDVLAWARGARMAAMAEREARKAAWAGR